LVRVGSAPEVLGDRRPSVRASCFLTKEEVGGSSPSTPTYGLTAMQFAAHLKRRLPTATHLTLAFFDRADVWCGLLRAFVRERAVDSFGGGLVSLNRCP
jgi:hypothetical protein